MKINQMLKFVKRLWISAFLISIGPRKETKLFEFLDIAKNVLNSNVQFEHYAGETDKEFPMYVADANWKGFFQIDGTKAYDAGLTNISIEETILSVARTE